MSLETFLDLSPIEFSEAYESFLDMERLREQNAWNRARWSIFKSLCPPEKKMINIFDIELFEWDKKGEEIKTTPSTRERFEEMKNKMPVR